MTRFTDKQVDVNIAEIKQADMDAVLVAEKHCWPILNAVSVSVSNETSCYRTMRLGAKGIKIMVTVLAALKSLS